MEEIFQSALGSVARVCELLVGACIVAGVLETAGRFVAGRGLLSLHDMRRVWLRLAAWIVLALELALAADIIDTAIAPSWDAIGRLAAIAGIRTALNFFLARDLKDAIEAEARRSAAPQGER